MNNSLKLKLGLLGVVFVAGAAVALLSLLGNADSLEDNVALDDQVAAAANDGADFNDDQIDRAEPTSLPPIEVPSVDQPPQAGGTEVATVSPNDQTGAYDSSLLDLAYINADGEVWAYQSGLDADASRIYRVRGTRVAATGVTPVRDGFAITTADGTVWQYVRSKDTMVRIYSSGDARATDVAPLGDDIAFLLSDGTIWRKAEGEKRRRIYNPTGRIPAAVSMSAFADGLAVVTDGGEVWMHTPRNDENANSRLWRASENHSPAVEVVSRDGQIVVRTEDGSMRSADLANPSGAPFIYRSSERNEAAVAMAPHPLGAVFSTGTGDVFLQTSGESPQKNRIYRTSERRPAATGVLSIGDVVVVLTENGSLWQVDAEFTVSRLYNANRNTAVSQLGGQM